MSDVKLGLVHDFFGTGAGNHAHTDSNFGGASPLAALLMLCRGTVLNTRAAHGHFSIGAAKSNTTSDLFTFYRGSEDASAAEDGYRKALEIKSAYLSGATGASRDGWTEFTSFTNNTVTWNVSNTYGSDFGTWSLLLGGADLNVDVGVIVDHHSDAADTSVATTTTGVDMTNGILMVFGIDENFTTTQGSDASQRMCMGFGSYDGTTFRQACLGTAADEGNAVGSPVAYLNDSHIYQRVNSVTGAAESAIEWTAATSSSFTTTVRLATAGACHLGYVAIGLPSDWNATVSVDDTPTSTGIKSFTPAGGTGWTPQCLLQILTLAESVDTAKVNDEAGGIGMRTVIGTGADDEYSISANYEDAATTTNVECGVHDSGFMNDDDGTAGYDSDLDSFVSGGWDDNYGVVHTNAKKVISLSFGEDDPPVPVSDVPVRQNTRFKHLLRR